MVRTRVQIKKIENIAARQVTFSKRRKGLFKKAQELATLCDAEIALIVFSSSDKLYEFSTSRVTRVIQRYIRHTEKVPDDQLDPSPMLLEEDCDVVSKEVNDKRQELRHLKGEDLEGLGFDELVRLEKQIEKAYTRVCRMKDDKLQRLITNLKRKENTLIESNKELKQKIKNAIEGELDTSEQQLALSPELNLIPNIVSFDTSLRLGFY